MRGGILAVGWTDIADGNQEQTASHVIITCNTKVHLQVVIYNHQKQDIAINRL